jgi:hypothetical protein
LPAIAGAVLKASITQTDTATSKYNFHPAISYPALRSVLRCCAFLKIQYPIAAALSASEYPFEALLNLLYEKSTQNHLK